MILHILPSLNIFGGTPRKVLDLVSNSKYEHIIYARDHYESDMVYQVGKAEFIKNGIRIEEGLHKKNPYKHLSHLIKIIKKKRIIIVCVYFDIEIILAAVLKFIFPYLKIIANHENALEQANTLKNFLKKKSLNKVDVNVFISDCVKNYTQKKYKNIINKNNIIIYNGTTFNNKSKPVKVNDSNFYKLVTISSLIPLKNIGILIDAAAILINKYKFKIHLDILGDGPEKNNLENQIVNYGLCYDINLLGHVGDVDKYLAEADIYLHPCLLEGFGIAVIEAMMMKKPVILSNAGALPELINDDCGLLAKPQSASDWAEKIDFLLSNKNLRENMAICSYNRALKLFSINKFVSRFDSLFDFLFDKKYSKRD